MIAARIWHDAWPTRPVEAEVEREGSSMFLLSAVSRSAWLLLFICRSLGVTELGVSLCYVRATLSGLVVRQVLLFPQHPPLLCRAV
jgi:hypothetical protein